MEAPVLTVHADAGGFDIDHAGGGATEPPEGGAAVAGVIDAGSGRWEVRVRGGLRGAALARPVAPRSAGAARGLFALLDREPLGEQAWTLVPGSADWANIIRFDLAGVIDVVREAAAAHGEESLENFEQGLVSASEAVGMDIEDDILAPFGDTWAIYSEPTFANAFGPGVCVVNDADDGARLAETLDAARQRINELLRAQGAGMQIAQLDMGGIDVATLSLPFVGVSWAVKDGRFYLAMSPAAILTAHHAAGDPENSLAASPALAAVRERLADLGVDGEPVSLTFADLHATAPRIYPTYAMLLNLVSGPIAQHTGVNAMTLLPPLGAMRPHLEPAGEISWFDPRGLHTLRIQPFPGSMLLSPEATSSMTTTTLPMALGVALPALGSARHNARRVASMSNLRQIGVALMTYATDHDEAMPPSLADLLVEGYLPDPSVLQSPGVARPLPGDLEKMPPEQRAAAVRRSTSYLLVARKKLNEIDNANERVLMFERPGDATDGRTVAILFYDMHVEQLPAERAGRIIEQQTGATIEQWIEAADAGRLPAVVDPGWAAEEPCACCSSEL